MDIYCGKYCNKESISSHLFPNPTSENGSIELYSIHHKTPTLESRYISTAII